MKHVSKLIGHSEHDARAVSAIRDQPGVIRLKRKILVEALA